MGTSIIVQVSARKCAVDYGKYTEIAMKATPSTGNGETLNAFHHLSVKKRLAILVRGIHFYIIYLMVLSNKQMDDSKEDSVVVHILA